MQYSAQVNTAFVKYLQSCTSFRNFCKFLEILLHLGLTSSVGFDLHVYNSFLQIFTFLTTSLQVFPSEAPLRCAGQPHPQNLTLLDSKIHILILLVLTFPAKFQKRGLSGCNLRVNDNKLRKQFETGARKDSSVMLRSVSKISLFPN